MDRLLYKFSEKHYGVDVSVATTVIMPPPLDTVMWDDVDGVHFYSMREEGSIKDNTIVGAHIYNRVRWGDSIINLVKPAISTSETLKAPLTGEPCTYELFIEMR